MAYPSLALREPLLHEAASCSALCNGNLLAMLLLIVWISLTMLLSATPRTHWAWQHISDQSNVIRMATGVAQRRWTFGQRVYCRSSQNHLFMLPWDSFQRPQRPPLVRQPSWRLPQRPPFIQESSLSHRRCSSLPGIRDFEPENRFVFAPEFYEQGVLSESVNTTAGVIMPRVVYGNEAGWDGITKDRMLNAIRTGFRGLDFAGEPSEYVGFGSVLTDLMHSAGIDRNSLFIQASVYPRRAESSGRNQTDEANLTARHVQRSLLLSLQSLELDYLDSLLLSGLYTEHSETMEAWRRMEDAQMAGLVRQIGLADVTFEPIEDLQRIYDDARVKPAVVQQPIYPGSMSERELRNWCADHGIYFQLSQTMQRHGRSVPPVIEEGLNAMAYKYGATTYMLTLRFVMSLGIVPLTSAATEQAMREDLSARSVPLTNRDCAMVNGLLQQEAERRCAEE